MKNINSALVCAMFLLWSFQALSIDMIVHNAKIKTFKGESYSSFAVDDGLFVKLSNDDKSIIATHSEDTIIIDAKGKRIIPGLNDSHTHVVRGEDFIT